MLDDELSVEDELTLEKVSGDTGRRAIGPTEKAIDFQASPPKRHELLASDIARTSTIMMVDDAPTTLKVLQAFLEDAGYRRFVTISRPEETFAALHETLPDLVLLDINMPGLSGFDILSYMREREEFEYTPVIVLTSSDDTETKLEALQLGATDFLAKPVDQSELVLRLRNTLVAKHFLDQQTYYDRVTGLANRRLFMDRLGQVMTLSKRDALKSAVLLVNVNRFKKINDSLGTAVGDELLRAIADRITSLVRPGDVVEQPGPCGDNGFIARIGGDEFTVLLANVKDVKVASLIAERLLEGLSASFQVQGRELFITVRIGIAVYPDHAADKDQLLRYAGVALSHAKKQGSNCFETYTDAMRTTTQHSIALETELHRALERRELMVYYQPKVDVESGAVAGAETLLRWRHPERGLVSPAEFIPLAEECGLIEPIGSWVISETCRQAVYWHANGLGGLKLAVNVSALQFRNRDFVAQVAAALDESGLPADCLTVELTESMMIEEAQRNIDILHELKALGVTLSVDDFGTGYSSLSYLEQFPLDELKIDRSFISKIGVDSPDPPIVSAIIAMAHSLNFRLVAEGVEEEEQLAFLRRYGCEFYQGFIFSGPLPAEDFAGLAAKWRRGEKRA